MSFTSGPASLPRAGSINLITDQYGNGVANVSTLQLTGGARLIPGGTGATMALTPAYLSTTQLASSQILAASGVPVTVVPAQGNGVAVVVLNSWYTSIAGTTAYVSGVGGLYYTGSGSTAADLGDKSVFRAVSGAMTLGGPVTNASGFLTLYSNTPVVYQATSGYISGNGTGIINVAWMAVPV